MRAIRLTSFGGLDALELIDMREPSPGEGEEVVEVRAVALGRRDLLAPEGWFVELGGSREFPQVQGWDFAGDTAGGRRVLGFVAQPWMKVGALAERIAVPSALLAELPDELDWTAGSSLPVCALTARQLVDTAAVERGDLVLITGAAGIVGGFAVELARRRGARVIGAVRTRDAEEARRLGVEATVDSGEPLEAELRELWSDGADACLDTVGLATALGCVRDGGAFITTETKAVPDPTRGITPEAVAVQPNAETLRELARRAASGELTIRVARTLPVADFRRGYELLRRGGLRGRIVLTF